MAESHGAGCAFLCFASFLSAAHHRPILLADDRARMSTVAQNRTTVRTGTSRDARAAALLVQMDRMIFAIRTAYW